MRHSLRRAVYRELRRCNLRDPFLPYLVRAIDGASYGVYRLGELTPLSNAVYLTPHHGGWTWLPYDHIVSIASIVDEADEFDTVTVSD